MQNRFVYFHVKSTISLRKVINFCFVKVGESQLPYFLLRITSPAAVFVVVETNPEHFRGKELGHGQRKKVFLPKTQVFFRFPPSFFARILYLIRVVVGYEKRPAFSDLFRSRERRPPIYREILSGNPRHPRFSRLFHPTCLRATARGLLHGIINRSPFLSSSGKLS